MKICHRCQEPRPFDKFNKRKDARDGLQTLCRDCQKEYEHEWRANNAEKRAASRHNWKANNRTRYNDLAAQYRARKKRATVIDIRPEQIEEKVNYYGGKCWVCRKPYEAIDHVKPLNKGGAHMLCNLRPICRACNTSKKDQWPYTL